MYVPEKACAEVLLAGEKGGATATMVFSGFGLGFVYQICMQALHLWRDLASVALHAVDAAGKAVGLKGATLSIELSPSLLGVGYIIGPKIANIMVAGGVLAYLVISPLIVFFGSGLEQPIAPAKTLISEMKDGEIRNEYILYIGAGAVAAGGIISMIKALPVILGALVTSMRDLTASQSAGASQSKRTDRDIPLLWVLLGSFVLVLGLMAIPQLGLGFGFTGVAGAAMIVVFSFLFVTVSSRLTGEIGSSSNPISGMTVATLLLTCLILLLMDSVGLAEVNKEIKLTALTIAGVVCVAASNGGSTAQALKVGHLLGATPRSQQIGILVGALTSALVVGLVLIAMNEANSTYSKKAVEPFAELQIETSGLAKDRVRSGPYSEDTTEYFVLNVGRAESDQPLPPGRYLINESGKPIYLVDPAINGVVEVDDFGAKTSKFEAPKTVLMQLIIDGILDQRLPWGLVLIGVLIAVTLELSGVPSLPFAVGVYLPLEASTPIFIGVRLAVDRWNGNRSGAEDDSGPAVLLSSGYIAGGAIAAVLISFLNFRKEILEFVDLQSWVPSGPIPGVIAFAVLAVILLVVGMKKQKPASET
ncbi:MAG: OPT/YSL family transporter [Pirellula sp.]|nr:OPT/YSL family transporter [Pirellula sp.]